MDSQDSSGPPPYVHHHYPHHPQPLPPSHHAVLVGPQIQIQQHPPGNSHRLPTSNNSFAPSTSGTSNSAMMHQPNPRFPFNSMAAASAAQKRLDRQHADGSPSGSGGSCFNTEPARKKRGRPRKYSPDNGIVLGLSSAPVNQTSSAVGRMDSGVDGTPSSETTTKRQRGRPPGSGKRQLNALGLLGVGFTPHVIIVNSGEDIASKIMAFSQQGPRTVCILSANGAICNVTLRQTAMTSGTVTYEGRFEIISLSGSFLLSESNGSCSQTGSLSVSLAGSDGRVLGGGVAGMLKAASHVQIVVGSFIAEGKKLKNGSFSTPSNIVNFGAPAIGACPPSPGASSESAEEDGGSPLDRGSGPFPITGQPVLNMLIYSDMGWPSSTKMLPN